MRRVAGVALGIALVLTACTDPEAEKAHRVHQHEIRALIQQANTHLGTNDFVSALQCVEKVKDIYEARPPLRKEFSEQVNELKRQIGIDKQVFMTMQARKGMVLHEGEWIHRTELASRTQLVEVVAAAAPEGASATDGAKPPSTPAPEPQTQPETVKAPAHKSQGTYPMRELRGKSRADLAEVFPGTASNVPAWGGWKEAQLTFDQGLIGLTLIPDAPMAVEAAESRLTEQFGLRFAGLKPRDAAAFRSYLRPIPILDQVSFTYVSPDDQRVRSIGIFFLESY